MRVWDIDPGFLNDKSLLGEHREIHGIHSILTQGKKGYSRHPETLRWRHHLAALCLRHDMLVQEMDLRGFKHQSPLPPDTGPATPPHTLIDSPADQFDILFKKYAEKPEGRIPLPQNGHALWAAHKYSVMARDPENYKRLGRAVARDQLSFRQLSCILVDALCHPPPPNRLTNALQHMWGYIAEKQAQKPHHMTPCELIRAVQKAAVNESISYLLHSTALGELAFWCCHTTTKGENHEKFDNPQMHPL